MTELVLTTAAAYGTYLVYTALAAGWTGLGPGPAVGGGAARRPIRSRLTARAGVDAPLGQVAAVAAVVAVLSGAVAFVVFGGPVPSLVVAGFATTFPIAGIRVRQRQRRDAASESWPRLIEEIRLRTGSLGRSIPQALFEVGERGPDELRPAFARARREWSLTTDFARATRVLKDQLADPTADATCETLLVAHELGGADVSRQLDALAEDRRQDLQGRKDAAARQAGARFARRFVLLVPIGMALAGLQIGDGRAAYRTTSGQLVAASAIGLVIICWWWAGRIMRLPDDDRVFTS